MIPIFLFNFKRPTFQAQIIFYNFITNLDFNFFVFSEKLKAMEREQEGFDVQDLHPCFTIASKAKEQFRKAQENYASLPNEPRYSHLAGDTPAILGEVHTYMLIIQLMVKTKSFKNKKTKEILLKFLHEPTKEHLQKVLTNFWKKFLL